MAKGSALYQLMGVCMNGVMNLAKLYFWARVRAFAKLYLIFPNRHIHSGIPKRKKEEPTSHPSEPLYAQNP